MTDRTLAGRTFVVTGGSMGIGFACAEEIVRRGARVVICARGRPALDVATGKLRKIAVDAVRALPADVTSAADVRRVFDAANELGGPDGIVHSAGIYGPIGPVVAVDPDEWFAAVRVDLFGTFLVAREAARRMVARGRGGAIVLLAGGGAGSPFPNYTAYACSKVGVVRFTETLAIELANAGIRVNCIAPGFVATRLHDRTLAVGEALAGSFAEKTRAELERGGVPPEVSARTAAFLLSPIAEGITGRFVAAPYDKWEDWPRHLSEIRDSDLFTLRRIVPRDRGMGWQ